MSYLRPIVSQIQFRSGYSSIFDLRQDGVDNGIFIAANGRLRRNLQGGAELRVNEGSGVTSGSRWSTSANVRTMPTRSTTLDVRWRQAARSNVVGQQQSDRLWDFSLGYRVTRALHLNAVHRRMDGDGLVRRQQRFWSLHANWKLDARSSARAFVSASDMRLTDRLSTESMMGGDLTFWPTRNFELRARFQYSRYSHRDSIKLYGVNLSRLF